MYRYWLGIQEQYKQLATKVDQVVLRERVLLLIVLLVIIYTFWLYFFNLPGQQATDLAMTKESALVQQVVELQQKLNDIENRVAKVPSNFKSQAIIPGSELACGKTIIAIFRALMVNHRGMTLKELTNYPDESLNLVVNNNNNLALPLSVYKQGVKLVFESHYLATYEYLRSLENLTWMLFWDELQYKVTNYPIAEVQLFVHTVSREKEH